MKFQDEFVHQLNSCTDLQQGRNIHGNILQSPQHRQNLYLANLCVHMYSRCGSLREAKQTFDAIPDPNIFTWNIMLTAYAHHGDLQQAELLFRSMPSRDIVSWTTMLTAFAQDSCLAQAEAVFDEMPMRNAISWNVLISAYAQYGHLEKAEAAFNSMPCTSLVTWNILMAAYSDKGSVDRVQELFDGVPQRDLVSWNILHSAFAQNGHLETAQWVLESMPEHDSVACSAMIAGYGQVGLLYEAATLYKSIPVEAITASNAMVTAYAMNGDLQGAKGLFDSMEQKDLITWNAMLASYAQHGMVQSAAELFTDMPERDPVSWNTMLSAFAVNGELPAAERLFESIPNRDVVTSNAMIAAYAQNGLVDSARRVFDSMAVHDRVSCNTMIGAYVESGDRLRDAKEVFDRMPPERTITSWNLMVEGFARRGHLLEAKQLIELMPEWSAVTWTSLMIGYTSRGDLEQAKSLFDSSPEKDCVSCNAMIQAYVEKGLFLEAIDIFESMPQTSVVSWTTMINLYSISMRFREALACFIRLPERNIVCWNAIVTAYAQNGHLRGSARLFETMPERDVISWSALVTAHARFGRADAAVNLFRWMEVLGVSPDSVFFLSILVACSQRGLIHQGCQFITMMIFEHGLTPLQEHYGSMVNLLGRAGELWNAEDLLHTMPYVAHVVAWGSLLDASKNQHEPLRRACAQQVAELDPGNCAPYLSTLPTPKQGKTYSSPRSVSELILSLKSCRNSDKGKRLHRAAIQAGLHTNKYVASALINMYSHTGCMPLAVQVFDQLLHRDVFLWTCLITGYVNNGMNSAAVECFTNMDCQPSSITFLAVLKAFGRLARKSTASEKHLWLEKTIAIHKRIQELGVEYEVLIATTLVDVYSKSGSMSRARELFDRMPARTAISWNSLLLGYVYNGEFLTALSLFSAMNCQPSSVTYVAGLQACGALPNMSPCFRLEKAMEIHKQIKEAGADSDDLVAANGLVDTYSKCGSLSHARKVFGFMAARDVVTWTSLILGYVNNGDSLGALELLGCMDCEPSSVTYLALLKACEALPGEAGVETEFALERTIALHREIIDRKLRGDILVSSTLLDVYSKLGALDHAREVFSGMNCRTAVTWNCLMLGYVANNRCSDALELFESMDCEPSSVSYVAALKACVGLGCEDGSLQRVIGLHKRIRSAELESDVLLANALVDAYGKSGSTKLAKEVFDELEERDVVTWNSVMAAYVENGESLRALELFGSMEEPSSTVTFVTVLKACACSASLEAGESIYARLCKLGLEQKQLVANSLVDLYVKCDRMSRAKEVFDKMESPDAVSWNTLIAGYSSLGSPARTFELAREMQVGGYQLDRVTFISLLTACSHMGLVEESKALLESMPKHGVRLSVEHYNCMVDVLSRASKLVEASALVKSMPVEANSVTWMTVLGACREETQYDWNRSYVNLNLRN